MIDEILKDIDIPYKECQFRKAPKSTYAVYSDSFKNVGADGINNLREHDITIELYEYEPQPAVEKAIENNMDTLGIPFVKQERYWLESEQLYQVIYEFSYYEKRRI